MIHIYKHKTYTLIMNNSSNLNCNKKKFIFSPDGLCNGMFSRLFRICKYDEHYKILKNENTTLSHNKKKLEEQIIVLLDKIVCCDQKNVTLKNEVIAKNNDITGMKKEIQHLLLSSRFIIIMSAPSSRAEINFCSGSTPYKQ